MLTYDLCFETFSSFFIVYSMFPADLNFNMFQFSLIPQGSIILFMLLYINTETMQKLNQIWLATET